ncbi:glycosyltransferase family 4 protein [Formosa sp. A9]|uniref:glycosyltransferase family 4 protein n=1 Tax=Formosa sp. A9 TaxID=3442641 RepID=UPI003EBECD04
MSKPLKIAIYTGVLPNTTFIENLILGVAEEHQVLLFGTPKKRLRYNHPNIQVIPTPASSLHNGMLTLWRGLRLVVKSPKLLHVAIREAKRYPSLYTKWMRFSRFVPVLLYQPDVFHLQWSSRIDRWLFLKDAYPCRFIVSVLGSQLLVEPHYNTALTLRYSKGFPKVDAIHAVSNDLAQQAIVYGALPERVQVIRTPVPQAAFTCYQESRQIRLANSLHLVSVGRHHWVKGYGYAISAVQALRELGITVRYTIIAEGAIPETLLYQVHDLGLTDVVTFKSGLPQDALFSEMLRYDALVLPSVSEGIANVVVEAMAIGLPVISSNCGGMPEVVHDGETGLLFAMRNVDAIVAACQRFMALSEAEVLEMLRQAHELVKREYHEAENVARMVDLYVG